MEEQIISDDLIKRSDAIKAVWGDDVNPSEDGMVFEAQSHIDRDIRLIPSADRATVIRVKSIMGKEDYDDLVKMIKQQNPNVIVIPPNAELVTPADRPKHYCAECKFEPIDKRWMPCSSCTNNPKNRDAFVSCEVEKKGADDEMR